MSRLPSLRDKELRRRYRYDADTRAYHIDVKADFYQDIANPWDFSPLQRRDLDDDLKEFLYESISEIPNRHTVILNFHLPRNLEDSDAERRSVTGIRSFLEYTLRTRRSHLKEMLRTAVAYALMGVLLLITAVIVQPVLPQGVVSKVVPEGLYVGGWVMIWEFFSVIFFRIIEIRREIGRYRRLLKSPIQYRYHNLAAAPVGSPFA